MENKLVAPVVAKLPADLAQYIRSNSSISSITQCTEELIQNALDAGSSCIAVRVDMSVLKVQVVDNGEGISKKDLEKIGSRFMTSKCSSLKDLERGGLCKYGYRGEALSNIRHMASILQIVSKKNTDNQTWTVLFARGRRKPIKEFYQNRLSSGTTVTVVDFLYNLPVRKKLINPTLDMQEIVQAITAISLANPRTSFTLKNEASGKKMLQTHQRDSASAIFQTIFGQQWKNRLLEIFKQSGKYSVRGFVGMDGASNTDKQFLYVNKRSVKSSKLFKIVNDYLRKGIMCRPIPDKYKKERGTQSLFQSTNAKLVKPYPIFCIELKLPFFEFDITFGPRKTEVEFENWGYITTFIERALEDFLVVNNLLPPCGERIEAFSSKTSKQPRFGKDVRNILKQFSISGITPLETTVNEQKLNEMEDVIHNDGKEGRNDSGENNLVKRHRLLATGELQGARQCLPVFRPSKKGATAISTPKRDGNLVPCFLTPKSSTTFERNACSKYQPKRIALSFKQRKDKYHIDEKGLIKKSTAKNVARKINFKAMNKTAAVASIQEQFGYRDIKHRLPLGCMDETVEKCIRWQIPSIPINSNQQSNPSTSNKGTMYELSRKMEAIKEQSTKDLYSSPRFPISKFSNLENSNVTIASPNKMTEDPPNSERSSGYSSYLSNNYSFFHEKTNVMEDTLYTQSLSRYSANDFSELQDQIEIRSGDETQESTNVLFGITNTGSPDSVARNGNEQEWPFAHPDASSSNTDVAYSGDDRIASLSKNEYSPSKPNSEIRQGTSSCLDESSTGLSAECSFFHENTDVVNDTHYTQNLSRYSAQGFLEPQGQIHTSSSDETKESNNFWHGINNGDGQDSVNKNRNEEEWPFAHLDASSWNADVENSEDERIAFWTKNEYSPRKRNSEVHHDTSFSSLDEPSIGVREDVENFHEKANECGSTNFGEPNEIGTFDAEVSILARSFDIERSSPIEKGIFGSLNSNVADEFELHDRRKSDFDGNAARYGFQNWYTPNNLGSHSTSGTCHPSQTISDTVPKHGTSPHWTTEGASFIVGTTDNMPCNESVGKNNPEHIPRSDSRLTMTFENIQGAWSDPEEPDGKEYSELDIKRTDFDLIENTVNKCNETPVKGALSKDWVQKTMGNGLTVYVHLPSGQTVHSPKCSSKVDSSKIIDSSETNLFSKRNLWPLPAGKSPFLLNKQRMFHKDKAIVTSHNCLHNELEKQNAHIENTVVEPQNNPKWTEGSYESWKGAECQSTALDNMLTSWTNPTFQPNNEIAHISTSARLAGNANTNSALRFRMDLFDKIRVLGQVDKKFIAVMAKSLNTSSDITGHDILLLFDQHAVHERIRLENLINEHFPGQTDVLSSKLDTPFEIPLNLEEKTISHGYQSKLRTFGLDFEFSAKEKHIQYNESHEHLDEAVETYLRVTHVPKCFALREENELKYNRSFSMAEMTTKLVKEIVDKIKITRGGGLGILPKTINDVLNSRACRGAVKFGDKLSLERCHALLRELRTCKAPFQCAHGRPSLAPIIELEKVRMCMRRSRSKSKLNFERLKEMSTKL